ncbi:MAG: SDR family NAD(P)-dependent oxidoreductase [Rhodoferax sp.]|nr:SDR family NAD(P)-dependent oxidoreductase [Rhodoferax sp.]
MHHLTIITGASRGMGLAIAQQLLSPTARLLCISRNTNAQLAEEAQAKGAQMEQWSQDLAQGEAAATALSAWLANMDSQTLASATLINNAALISAMVPLRDANPAELATALRVGLEAPMQLTAAFLGATRGWQAPRKVLNISSGLGRCAMASSASYCAAKAGMDHFTRCVALDEASLKNGAKVCSLAPGVIDTDMQVQLRTSDPAKFPDVAMFAGMHNDKQLSSPQEAAQKVIAFLNRPDFGADPIGDVRQ